MKRVVISIDDGRLDTYEKALRHLKNYGLTATVNITTDFVEHPECQTKFPSALNKAMTIEMVQDAARSGIEIAGHGNHHMNNREDIVEGIRKLQSWGVSDGPFGFASPFSELTEENNPEIMDLLHTGFLRYIRSGIQVRRESFFYKVMYLIMEKTQSCFLFFLLNRKNCKWNKSEPRFLKGVSVTNRTTVQQIKYMIKKLPDQAHLILIFHSILPQSHPGYGKDKWYMDEELFLELCENLKNDTTIQVLTTRDLVEEIL